MWSSKPIIDGRAYGCDDITALLLYVFFVGTEGGDFDVSEHLYTPSKVSITSNFETSSIITRRTATNHHSCYRC